MTDFEKKIEALTVRYQQEVRDLGRAVRGMAPSERLIAQTHANVKEAALNEIRRIMDQCGVKRGGRA